MTISPQDIQAKQFHTRMRGFDMDEVDKFLEKIAEEFLVVTLENKQLLDKIATMEKELANYRNKEQAFQSAILAAQRISDEMQAKSRREADEIVTTARETAGELEERVQREVDEILETSRREASELKENAESEAQRILENSKREHRELTANINRLIEIKDRILADLRQLLNNYLEHIDQSVPTGLNALEPLPIDEEAPPAFSGEEPASPDADLDDDDLEDLYEKIDLPDHPGTPQDDEPATLDINDIKPLETTAEDPAPAFPAKEPDEEEMLFSLDDPLDDLEPSISISDEDKAD
ncbi:MAG: DivIVA domain-containing protein [Desulfurivibrionaceae bacterium]|nr:DivIVA domain-containing protein [Desulfobulbales bacterium]MDT8334621.1 DivIVA domain-containing protein [Desulfurivibrionaceae bacterium]